MKFETVSVLDNFLECIFPPRCFVCDRLLETADIRRQRNVHAACRKKLYPVVQPYCYHCGSPLVDTETEYCQNCRKHRSFVAEGRSLFVYRGAVQKSMYRFKYANRRRYARFLADAKAGIVQDILLEVNIGGEESKTGAAPELLWPLLDTAAAQQHIRVKGLMAIPPVNDDDAQNRRYLAQVYQLFVRARESNTMS